MYWLNKGKCQSDLDFLTRYLPLPEIHPVLNSAPPPPTPSSTSELHMKNFTETYLWQTMKYNNKLQHCSKCQTFVSLHIRSMWETICDAQAGFCVNSEFLSKFSRTSLSGISDQSTPFPWKLKFRQILALWVLTTPEYLIPPWKLKFRQILALWVLTTPEYPLPPKKLKFRQILGHFEFWLLLNTPPPPPPPPNPGGGSFRMWRLIFIIRIIFHFVRQIYV